MEMPILAAGALAVIVLVPNIWATRTIRSQTDVPSHQRRWQVVFVWLVPVIGALIAIEVYRRIAFRRPRQRLVADEIHPIIDQAMRPVADAQTRASEHYIEQELTDFGHDGGGHADGSS